MSLELIGALLTEPRILKPLRIASVLDTFFIIQMTQNVVHKDYIISNYFVNTLNRHKVSQVGIKI